MFKYDDSSDTFGVKVTHGFQYDNTVEMDDGLLLDFDENNVPVSLEILDASKRFNLPKESLRNVVFIKVDVFVDVSSICLKIVVNTIENKQKIDSYASNYCNLPNMDVKLALV